MITNFIFEKDNSFIINGTIDLTDINLEIQNANDIGEIYKDTISKMLEIKKTIVKALSNDNKIIGNERIELIKAIDHFLVLLITMSLVFSDTPLIFTCKIADYFSLSIQASKTKVFKIIGNIYNVSPKDPLNYNEWLENNIFLPFKELIELSSKIRENKEEFMKKLTNLFFNIITLRYKIEYI